jgi:hypothetical protein
LDSDLAMSKRSRLRLGLSIALGVAYGLYFETRGGGLSGWILAVFAAIVAMFLSQAFVGPDHWSPRQEPGKQRAPTEPPELKT